MPLDEEESKVHSSRKSTNKSSRKSSRKLSNKHDGRKDKRKQSNFISKTFEKSKPKFKKLNKVAPLKGITTDDNDNDTATETDTVDETETSPKLDFYRPKDRPGVDPTFHTYSPPLGHYEFYKSYEEYVALLKEYKTKGLKEKYDALSLVWQDKMKLELLQRFPWPPKLARGTFWTYGYYRDYYPPETLNKPVIPKNKYRASLVTFFFGEPDTTAPGTAAPSTAATRTAAPSHGRRQTKTAANYLDSTDVSTVVEDPEADSMSDDLDDIFDESLTTQTYEPEPSSKASIRSQKSVKYIVIPEEEDDEDDDDPADETTENSNRSRRKSRRKSRSKSRSRSRGRRSTAFPTKEEDISESFTIPSTQSGRRSSRSRSRSRTRSRSGSKSERERRRSSWPNTEEDSKRLSIALPDVDVPNAEERKRTKSRKRIRHKKSKKN